MYDSERSKDDGLVRGVSVAGGDKDCGETKFLRKMALKGSVMEFCSRCLGVPHTGDPVRRQVHYDDPLPKW